MAYRKFTRSRYDYPTTSGKGHLDVGSKAARSDIENKLKRPLNKETKVRKRGGNWIFLEPIE